MPTLKSRIFELLDSPTIPRWRISTISQATGIPRWSLWRYLYCENISGKIVTMSAENTYKLAQFVAQHCRGKNDPNTPR